MSVESELLSARERARAREEMNVPYEQSKRVSELVVGPVENIPKSETAARALATAVDYAILLPAETIRTPVTTTEFIGELKEKDVLTTFDLPGPTDARVPGIDIKKAAEYAKKDVAGPIISDPAGSGVRAGITAGLILLPAAKVVRSRTSMGSPGRTSYEVAVPKETVPSTKLNIISDFTYEPAKGPRGGIKSTGTVKVKGAAAQSFLEVAGETVPEGKGYKTTVRARRATRSKMDLTEVSDIRGDVITEKSGDVTRSRSAFRGEDVVGPGKPAQVDLMGNIQPKEEIMLRSAAERRISQDLDVGIGGSSVRESILNMKARESVDLFGRRLVFEERSGPKTRRVTYTKEAVVNPEDFARFLERRGGPRNLGIDQDTLRSFDLKFKESGKGPTSLAPQEVIAAEQAMQKIARSLADVNPPSPRASTPGPSLKTRPKSGGAQFKPPSPGPVLLKSNVPVDDRVYVRYPRSDGTELGRQPRVNAPDMGIKQGSIEAESLDDVVGSVVRTSSRSSRSSRTRQVLTGRRATAQEQGLGMLSVQDLGARMASGQRTEQRQDTMVPIPEPRISERYSPIPRPGARPGRVFAPPAIPPIITGPSGSGGLGGRAPSMGTRFGYGPSLVGIGSGVEIDVAPSKVTGLEIRPPVRKKRKKRR